jgi:hypothetical protein
MRPSSDVADDMVERLQADARVGVAVLGRRDVAGQVRACVLAAVDEVWITSP